MYTITNFKTKKALKEAVRLYNDGKGKKVEYYQPGLGDCPKDGSFVVEMPHYPEPHRVYANCVAEDNGIISVK